MKRSIQYAQQAGLVMGVRAYFVLAMMLVSIVLQVSEVRAAGGDIDWQYGDARVNMQVATAAVVDAGGNTIVTGYTQGATEDFLTVCVKADGSGLLWSATLDLAGGNDRASAVALDQDGNVLVTGSARNGATIDFHTIKYNGATGAVIWQHSFDAGNAGADYPAAVSVDGLNNVYVAGRSQGVGGNDDFMLIKYPSSGPTAEGKPLWQRSFNSAANDNDGVMAMATASTVAITGYSRNGSNFDWLTRVYATDGTLTWSKVFDSTFGDDQGSLVALDSDGSVVVTGYVANGTDSDILTRKYSAADGTVLWSRTHDGGYGDEPKAMRLSGGEVYLTGVSYSLAGFNDFYTARLAGADGVVVWGKSFDSGGGNADVPAAIAVDAAGDVFVAGSTQKFSADSDWQTIKYSRDAGIQLWQRSFNGAAGKDDKALGLGFGATGALRVAGWSDQWTAGASDNDYRVIRYDAGLLNAPSLLAGVAASDTAVTLSWQDNSANEDGFAIWRDSGSGYQEIATVAANVTAYADSGLTAHLWYSYKVQAYSAAVGDSHFSNEARVLTTVISYAAPSFSYIYNSVDNGDDFAWAVAVGPDGDPVVTGSSLTAANGSYASDDYFTVKLNRTDASVRWTASYNDADDEMDQAVTVSVDTDNTVVVSGNSSLFGGAANTNDLYTRKYLSYGPADGAPYWGDPFVWGDAYNGPGGGSDRAVKAKVIADGSGDIAVTGYGQNGSANDDIYLIRYLAATGARVWTATPYNGGANDYPADLASDTAGNVFVAGRMHNGSNTDIFLRKYNAASGATAWTVVYNHAAAGDEASSVAVDGSGNVYLTGFVTQGGNKDYYTAKYNGATGAVLWSQTYSGPGSGDDTAMALALDPISGEVVVAGTRLSGAGNNDFHVIRYDAAGNPVWSKTLDRPGNQDYAVAMSMDLAGNICVAGNTGSVGAYDVLTISYDSSGTIIGSSLFNGAASGNDQAAGVAANRFGETFVVGHTINGAGNADYLVMNCNGTVLSPPSNLAAAPLYTSVGLSWTDNSLNEDAFQIERKIGACDSANPWTAVVDTAADATSYNDTALNTGTSYCYRLRSHAASGLVSPWVETATATTSPLAPTGLAASVLSSTRIDLSWTDNTTGEDSFEIQRCAGSGCADFDVLVSTAANATSYSDTSVCEGVTYSYRLLAIKADDWVSPLSAIVADRTTPSRATPGVFTASRVSEGQVNLTWTDTTSDETGFEVDRCQGAGCDFSVKTTTLMAANATSYSDTTSILPDETYRYRIRSYKTASCSWYSDYSAVSEAITTLMPPSALFATPVNTTRVDLSWTDNTGFETGFEIDRCIGVGCDFSTKTTFTVGAGGTSYSDTSVCEATPYNYQVRAVKTASWNSNYSTADPATTAGSAAPVLTGVTRINERRIDLSWTDTTSDESGFEIERCVGAACDFSVKTTIARDSGATSYSDTGLLEETTYRYRVRAVKAASCSWNGPWSDMLSATTSIAPPSALSATTASTTRIDLAWTDNTSYESSFVVERCAGGGCSNFAEVGAAASDATSYADTGVCNSTAYRYQIKAINEGLRNGLNACWTRQAPVTVTGFAANTLVRTTVAYDGDMQVDFDDLRFYDDTAGVELPYWIETKTDGASAVIWFKTGDNNTISLYYGNASATGVSDSTEIFDFYDAFRGITIDTGKWVEIDPNNSIAQNDGLLFSYVNAAWSKAFISQQTFTRAANKVFYTRIQAQNGASSDFLMAGWELNQAASANYNQLVHGLYWSNGSFAVYEKGNSVGVDLATSYTLTNTDYEMMVELKSAGARYYIRGGAYPAWRLIKERSDLTDSPMRVAFVQNSHQMKVDFAAVSSYRIPDALASLGAEASSACYPFGSTWQSASSNIAADTTATPLNPTGLTATAASESQIDLIWTDAAIDETGYRIERCQGVGCSNFALVASRSANTTSYSDTGLPQGVTFGYRVEAYKVATCGWDSVYSNTAFDATLAPPPPTGLAAATVDTTRIDLSFTDNTGSESGFVVERCSGGGCSNFAEIDRTAADVEAYADTGVCYGTAYTYQVKAFNQMSNDGGGAWTRRALVTITDFQADFETRLVVAYDADMQADYDDLRFYDETAQAELPYWIESFDAGSAVVWFRTGVNDNVAMYYGNPQATSSSSGTGVFLYYDDFETFAGWTTNGGGAVAQDNTRAYAGTYAGHKTTSGDPGGAFKGFSAAIGRDVVVEFMINRNSAYAGGAGDRVGVIDADGNGYGILFSNSANTLSVERRDAFAGVAIGGYNIGTLSAAHMDEWLKLAMTVKGDGTVLVERYINDVLDVPPAPPLVMNGTDSTYSSFSNFYIFGGYDYWIDQVKIRHYAATQPGAVLAAEEVASTPAAWSTTYSNTAGATTASLAAAPVLSGVRVSEARLDLSWNDPASDESGYQIERCTGASCSAFALLTTTAANATSYSDTAVSVETTYRYKVRAVKSATCGWNGPFSNITTDITASVVPPGSFAATPVNTTRIDLSWTDNTTSETGFEIERCAGSGCSSFAPLTTVAADATSYTDDSVAHSTPYRYRVRAAGSGWNSSYSTLGADVLTPTPGVPSSVTASRVSEVAINLSWSDNTSDETGFEIERCTGSGCSNFAPLSTAAANTTSFADTGLAADTIYRFQVRAFKTATQSWNTAYSATTSATTTVLAPTVLAAATPNTTQVNLTWTDNTVSETGFAVERCEGGGCSAFASLGTAAANATSYSDTTVCSGTTYSYQVRAVKSATWNSPYSGAAADVSPPVPTAPSGLAAISVSEDQVDVSWADNTADESGFELESCSGDACGGFGLLNAPAENQTSYSDTGLAPSTTYCYRVRAVKAATCGWSSAYSDTSCDLSIQAAPNGLSATALDSMKIRLDWTDNASDETGYWIEELIWNGTYTAIHSVAANTTSYVNTLGIEGGKSYTYRVRAVRGADLSAATNDATATTPAYQAGDTVCP